MQISFTFRNTESGDGFKEYISKKLTKLERYLDVPVEARVVLSVEKYRNSAEINLILAKGATINAREEATEMIPAVDAAIDKIERRLKKHKEKTRGRKETGQKVIAEGLAALPAADDEGDEDASVRVVETRRVVLDPMSVDEALLRMEDSRSRFMLFRDAGSENISAIYRRDDGNYELIETAG